MEYCKFSTRIFYALFCLICTNFLISYQAFAQDPLTVNVIPPSPNASSFHVYGNTDVGLYTGALNVNIPIYNVQTRSLSLPISLSYSGSGGIKVEEVASWVGIGWSLNAGGAVSRVIRGKADDAARGFDSEPDLPVYSILNVADFEDFADGTSDGEPDKFFYNANGLSGSFFIKKNGDILQIPEQNVLIVPEYFTSGPETGELSAFVITNTDGTVYRFETIEEVRSRLLGTTFVDTNHYGSSWYLTRISNAHGTDQIDFTYEPYSTIMYTEVAVQSSNASPTSNNPFETRRNYTETNAQRLSEITFNNGKVVFVAGANRCDFVDDKYLEAIEVQDLQGNLVKKFSFDYSYFDATLGTVALSTPCDTGVLLIGTSHDGDFFKRLRLDAVTELGSDGVTAKPAHLFEYHDQRFLPSRHSLAKDHWGYYNGAANTSLEPEYQVRVRNFDGSIVDYVLGDADREPNFTFSQAGVLEKISYPTGGYSLFEYEQHQAFNDALPNSYVPGPGLSLPFENTTGTITLTSVDDLTLAVTASLSVTPTASCDIEIHITNTTSQEVQVVHTESIITLTNQVHFLLEPGTYDVFFVIDDNTGGGCFPVGGGNPDVFMSLTWNNEVYIANKPIGGLRIKNTEDYDREDETKNVIRTFSYMDTDETTSSGRLVTVPEYGYVQTDGGIAATTPIPIGWVRTVNSNIPLATTKGSHVGYGRVLQDFGTVAEPGGRSEYFYTTAEDFPDLTRGWTQTPYDDYFQWDGELYYSWPYVPTNTKDWKRGLLTQKIDYKLEAGLYKKVKRVTNTYEYHGHEYSGEIIVPPLLDNDPTQFIHGVHATGSNFLYVKFYNMYTGRYHLIKTEVDDFRGDDDTQFLRTTTDFFYESDDHYQLTRQTTTDSEERVLETQIKYPQDYASPAASLTEMINRNMIALPIEQINLVGIEVTQATGTKFFHNTTTGVLAPEEVYLYEPSTSFVASTDGEFFASYVLRGAYEYDDLGNVVQFAKTNDVSNAFLWGYNRDVPILQATNAVYSDITSNLTGTELSLLQGDTQTDAQVRTTIDGLRSDLPTAQITALTYDPLVGRSSASDPNNQTTFFEYDLLNRLETIYLETVPGDGLNILEHYSYHYQGHDPPAPNTPLLNVSTATIDPIALAGSTVVNVTSNGAWTASSDDTSWLTVTPSSGSDNADITIDYTENIVATARTATITVSGQGLSENITVTQAAGTPPPPPTLTANPTFLLMLVGNDETINITSNTTWSVNIDYWDEEDLAWLDDTAPLGGSGNGSITVSANTAPTEVSETWEADIVITGGGLTQTVHVEIAGGDEL